MVLEPLVDETAPEVSNGLSSRLAGEGMNLMGSERGMVSERGSE
jgi:hypothetical protein